MSCQNNCFNCKCHGTTPVQPMTTQEKNNQQAEELASYCCISVVKNGLVNTYLLPSKDKNYRTIIREYDNDDTFIDSMYMYYPHAIHAIGTEFKNGKLTHTRSAMYHYWVDGNRLYVQDLLPSTTRTRSLFDTV